MKTCRDLGVSVIVTANVVVTGTDGVELHWLPREELFQNYPPIVRLASSWTNHTREEVAARVQNQTPLSCSPLLAFLINLLFIVDGVEKFNTHINSINKATAKDETEERRCRIIFHKVLSLLSVERLELLSALYSLPPCAR